jgi:uncharacterized membrane protein
MFDNDKFENAINGGRYIEAVDETLKADPDDDKEELREHLFGKKRIFEKALRQAIVAENPRWLSQLNQQFPDWWTYPNILGTANNPKYDYYKDYRSRFIKTQLRGAWIVACEKNDIASLVNDIDFPPGMLYDMVHIFGSSQLHPLKGINVKKVPVLLVDDSQAGYVASLCLEQVDLTGVDSPPYPHPVKMSGIPIDKRFEKTVENAFNFLNGHLKEKLPVFRWWLEPLSPTQKIKSVKGPSLYGAFMVGMYGSTLNLEMPEHLTITCSGDMSGNLIGINGLAHKFEAATKEDLKIVVSGLQDYDEDNLISDAQKKTLLKAETAEELFEPFFCSQKISPENAEEETPMTSTPIQTQPSTGFPHNSIGAVKTFFEVADFKSFIYQLFAVIAGVAGLGILLVLFTYEPLIEAIKTSSEHLEAKQTTLLYISIIVSVSFIAILAIYTRIIQPTHLGGVAQPFRNVLSFIVLIVIILSSIGTAIYWWKEKPSYSPPPVTRSSSSKPPPPPICLNNYWCSQAKEALLKYDNKLVALEYVNKGLEETQNNPLEYSMLLAFKIKLLLLIGDTTLAKNEADKNYGRSPVLNQWINCLRAKQFFSSLVVTETELETKCSSPYNL